jgi:hypothetical protein
VKIRPIGWLFSLGSFMKIYRSSPHFGATFFLIIDVMYSFWQKWVWIHFG